MDSAILEWVRSAFLSGAALLWAPMDQHHRRLAHGPPRNRRWFGPGARNPGGRQSRHASRRFTSVGK